MIAAERFVLAPRARNVARAAALVGVLAVGVGLAADPDRTWPNLLMNGFFAVALAIAGVVSIALQFLSGASWNAKIRRIPEALMAPLPAAGAVMLVLFFGRERLYPWSRPGVEAAGAAKAIYFGAPLFFGRMALFIAVWTLFAWLIRRSSLQQDRDAAPIHHQRLVRYSAAFMVVFAVSFSLASFDWLMSLVPHWSSAIFAVYWFAGVLSGGTAAITLAVVLLAERGYLAGIADADQRHDLGKLLFAFSTFWAYIWLSQYLLIWYGNLPEETPYYISRTSERWIAVFLLNLALNWVVPFVVLLRRDAKRSAAVLKWISIVMLAGRWLDLYVAVMPEMIAAPNLRPLDIAILIGCVGAFFLTAARALERAPLVPGLAVALRPQSESTWIGSDDRV
jgi:hypothetical protein